MGERQMVSFLPGIGQCGFLLFVRSEAQGEEGKGMKVVIFVSTLIFIFSVCSFVGEIVNCHFAVKKLKEQQRTLKRIAEERGIKIDERRY